MKSLLESLEEKAKIDFIVKYDINSIDSFKIEYFPINIESDNEFYYYHNGVEVSRQRASELIPWDGW